jgi:hypothetical protein
MGLREIRQSFEKLYQRFLPMGAVENEPEMNHKPESGNHAGFCDWERGQGSEQRHGIRCELNGHLAAPPSIQRKTDIAAGDPAKRHLCASDIARGILGANSGVGISNILVIGTNGSTPLKRMEIHFDDAEKVTAYFNILATALKSRGVEFHAARSCEIPATEIWLTCPLEDRKKQFLSRRALHEDALVTPISQSSPSSGTEPESSHFAGIQ